MVAVQLVVEKPWPIHSSLQSRGVLSGLRALTVEHSLMSGCGEGHELVKDRRKKLWLKFLGLTQSRSGHTGEKSATSLNKT